MLCLGSLWTLVTFMIVLNVPCTICPAGRPCFALFKVTQSLTTIQQDSHTTDVKSLLLLSFPAEQQTSGFVVQLISSLTKAFPR